jgi:hypothetical protein
MVKLMEKKSFVRSGEGSVASYQWTDIADGSGYVRLYVLQINDEVDSADDFTLATKAYYCGATTNKYMQSPSAWAVDLTPFNTPRTISGKAIANCGKVTTSSGDGSITVHYYKVSGGVETSISADISSTGAASGSPHIAIGTITETSKEAELVVISFFLSFKLWSP